MRRVLTAIASVSVAVAGFVLVESVKRQNSLQSPGIRFSGGGSDGYGNSILVQSAPTVYIPPRRFSGGEADGHAVIARLVNQHTITPPSRRYSGGSQDGHAAVRVGLFSDVPWLPSARFSGGPMDGYVHQIILWSGIDSNVGAIRFSGGSGDGFANAIFRQSFAAIAGSLKRFYGGSLDGYGWATRFAALYPSQNISPRYSGGGGDGHDTSGLRVPHAVIVLDRDMDGIPDWWEELYFGGPTNATADALSDESQMTNLEKYIAGLSPGDRNSIFVFTAIEHTHISMHGTSVVLKWPTIRGRLYRVYSATDLKEQWPSEPTCEVEGSGLIAECIYFLGASGSPRFFKLTVEILDE